MKHRRVINRFQDWNEGRMSEAQRLEIQRHLDDCGECRRYFEKMTTLMEGIGPVALPHLEPDPFLPDRIRANAAAADAHKRGAAKGRPQPIFGRLAVSMMSVAVVVAAVAGILLGNGLYSRAEATAETEALAGAYYEAFSPTDFATDWEDALSEEDEGENS